MSTDLTEEDWNSHKAIIRSLYITENRKLLGPDGVIQQISNRYGFNATKAQYERRFKRWGFQKKQKSDDWKIIALKVTKRKREMKDTEVRINGEVVPTKKLKKELSQYGYEVAFSHHQFQGDRYPSAPSPKTPEGMLVCTPQALPDMSYAQIEFPWLKFKRTLESLVSTEMELNSTNVLALGTISLELTDFMSANSARHRREAKLRSYLPDSAVDNKNSAIGASFVPSLNYFSMMMYLISNNLMPISDDLLTIFESPRNKSLVLLLLHMKTTTNRVFIQKLFKFAIETRRATIIEMLDPSILLDSWGQSSGVTVLIAFQHGYIKLVKRLVAAGAEIKTHCGQGALQKVAISGDIELAKLLIEAGADVNARATAHSPTAIQEAARRGNIELAKLLIEAGANVNARATVVSGTAIQEAARFGVNIELVKLLIEAGADVNARATVTPGTAIQEAAKTGNIELAKLLTEAGADVNARVTVDSPTAIQEAVMQGNIALVRVLIEEGADVNATGSGFASEPALLSAARINSVQLVRNLLGAGARANVSVPITPHRSPLLEAVCNGNIELVQLLLNAGAYVNFSTGMPSTNTPLLEAIRSINIDLVRLLLDAGADVNSRTVHTTPLLEAVWSGNRVLVRLLLDFGASVNKSNRSTALHGAIGASNYPLVRLLMDAGADVDATALLWAFRIPEYHTNTRQTAVQKPNTELIRLLLTANPAIVTGPGTYALYAAVYLRDIELVKLLLGTGANVNAIPPDQVTGSILQETVRKGDCHLAAIILDAGAYVNCPGLGICLTALQEAASLGDINMAQLLLLAGADVSAPAAGPNGRTALQSAVWNGCVDLIQHLLYAGAAVNASGSINYGTALQLAIQKDNAWIVDLLLLFGAEINPVFQDCKLKTPLQGAAWVGRLQMVEFLLEKGADINAGTGDCRGTALQAAVNGGHTEVTKYLLRHGADVNAVSEAHSHEAEAHCREIAHRIALQVAVDVGNIELVRLLLSYHADPNIRSPRGPSLRRYFYEQGNRRTPLHSAVWMNRIEKAQLLVEAGADVNSVEDIWIQFSGIDGWYVGTPLLAAVGRSSARMVQLLLNAGAEPNISAVSVEKHHLLPLQLALCTSNMEIFKLLLNAGANASIDEYISFWNSGSKEIKVSGSLLAVAVQIFNTEIAHLLIDAGAKLNLPAVGRFGRTALQAAVEKGEIGLVERLIKSGADVNAPPSPKGGATALQLAAIYGYAGIASVLLKEGADTNADGAKQDGRTVLEGAAEHGRVHLVQMILNVHNALEKPAPDYVKAWEVAFNEGHHVVAEMIRAEMDEASSAKLNGLLNFDP